MFAIIVTIGEYKELRLFTNREDALTNARVSAEDPGIDRVEALGHFDTIIIK